MRKPDFLIIGAQKAGTTTLHDWLITQSQLSLPNIKETHFFSKENRFEKGYNWYIKQFDMTSDKKIIGEVDPDYIFMPGVIEKIRQYIKKTKFIIILRSPIERAYSHYKMSCYRGYEKLSFLEALKAENNRLKSNDYHSVAHFSYLSRSFYAPQIIKFKKAFPDSAFYFSNFDDLFSKDHKEKEFTSICEFIGFTPDTSIIDFDLSSNVASTPRSTVLHNLIYNKNSPIKKIVRPFARLLFSEDQRLKVAQQGEKFNRAKKKLNPQRLKFKPSQELREQTIKDLDKLQTITGLDVSYWHREEYLL
ncbi:MAG: sulfotransferase domain-containing protein [Proteobacteria bacterium]|nr:sulfotransferase domain-containing protein [Pseudomonadota bacterium]MBU1388037.1 sulfotransferase domain-containing protein [Pseudomonadota bacterium]MBU1542100.1 sulfotransferase domain-containing protein [Pseudomonadota bacterium]